MERNKTIDAARGIAILLVVLGHSIGDSELLVNRIILSFHMPIFFFLSGYLASEKSQKFVDYVAKKSCAILIPQICLAILRFCYLYCVSYRILGNITAAECNIIECFLEMWFLLVLWQVYILWGVWSRAYQMLRNYKYSAILLCALLVLICFLVPKNESGFLYWNVTPIAFSFFIFGHYISRVGFFATIRKKVDVKLWALLLLACVCMLAYFNTPVLMFKNQYGNIFVFLFTSVFGIMLIMILGYMGQNIKILQYFGKNSIAIYVLHFNLVQGLRGIISRISPCDNVVVVILLVFFLAVSIVTPISYLTMKYIPWIYGKTNAKSR